MRLRLAAWAVLGGSLLVGVVAATVPLVALTVQALLVVSVSYVAFLAWRGWRVMSAALRGSGSGPAPDAGGERPFVTLIVPARDEASVIEAVTRDLGAQDYHTRGEVRFEVLIVDDASADATGAIARRAAGDYGERVRVVRREPGSGPATRGAALDHAMSYARGELIAAIDADSRVAPDFVARAIHAWGRDPQAAALQVLRRPTNARRSWLTAAQEVELLIDAASQCGRWSVGGTSELRGNGMFVRRGALEHVGGWGSAALTEDLDLSTRLAAAGERITLAPEVAVGEEAVEELRSLWPQRLRWAEGSARRLIEQGPRLLAAPLSLRRKLDFVSFLAEFVVPPLITFGLVSALVASALGVAPPGAWTVPLSLVIGYGAATMLLALAGLAADARRGTALVGGALRGTLFLAHWLVAVPAALGRIALGAAEPRYVKTPRARERPAVH